MSEGSGADTENRCQRAPSTVFCTPVTVHNIGSFLPNRPLVFCQGGQQIGQQGAASPTVAEVIPKLCVKAVSKSKKKDAKTFVLRNICIEEASSVPALKNVIKKQLKNDIDDDFDVGVMEGTLVVNLRTQDDLKEFWIEARKGRKVLLWCDG